MYFEQYKGLTRADVVARMINQTLRAEYEKQIPTILKKHKYILEKVKRYNKLKDLRDKVHNEIVKDAKKLHIDWDDYYRGQKDNFSVDTDHNFIPAGDQKSLQKAHRLIALKKTAEAQKILARLVEKYKLLEE